jgi:hypothetical protein
MVTVQLGLWLVSQALLPRSHMMLGGELAHECYVTSPIIWQMIKLDVPLVLFVSSVRYGQDWAQYSVRTYIEHLSPSASFHISHWWSMKKNLFENLNSHWLRKILSPLSSFCSCDWPNCLQSYYINDRIFFFTYHFSIQQNQFSHSEDGGSTILRNVETFSNCMVWKPKRRPPSA